VTDFTDAYVDLLIKQYWEQPNARAEIEAQATTWEAVRDGLLSFGDALDIDVAIGTQLDVLGRIVGIPRSIPLVIPKIAFGFADNVDARGFDDKFVTIPDVAPFQDRFETTRTALELDDFDYRQFIKARIAANIGGPQILSDVRTSIQEAIQTLFENRAYVVDKFDMTLRLYVSPAFNADRLTAIRQLDLLPRPQGVRYDIVEAAVGETFGFDDNPDALGFGDKFDAAVGGVFANKVI
jgi:hypothetical protein